MKVCFPIIGDEALKSQVNSHFGSTENFLIYDTDSGTYEVVSNADSGHVHGMCQPLKALSGKTVDAVVVGGLGAGALQKLNAMGIKVYRAVAVTVSDNAQMLKENKLEEINAMNACAGHGQCGH